MVGYRFRCISWLKSFIRSLFSNFQPLFQSYSQFHPLTNHHPYQQPLFFFPVIHSTSPLYILNQQQKTILKNSQIFITSLIQSLFHRFHPLSSTTSILISQLYNKSYLLRDLSPHSAVLPIIFLQSLFSLFLLTKQVRHYSNYLYYFHKLAITPKETTIPDPIVRVLVTPFPLSLSRPPDLGCFQARRIMFLGRILV